MIGCSICDAGRFKNDDGQMGKLFDMYLKMTEKVSA